MRLTKMRPIIGSAHTSIAADDVDVFGYKEAIAVSRIAVSSRGVWPTAPEVPATYGYIHGWQAQFARRVGELSRREGGWDGYEGVQLAFPAVAAMATTLSSIEPFLGTGPKVSLTSDGGLLCGWVCHDVELEIEADPDGDVSVFYSDPSSGVEEDCPLAVAYDLEKWAWQASWPA